MTPKEKYYKYGESLGIKINDLQRLKMLADNCQQDMADYIFKVAKEFHRLGKYSGNTSDTHFTDIYKETINSLNKQD